jgi:hypothetical protein
MPRQIEVEAVDAKVRGSSEAAMPTEISLLDDLLLHLNHGMTPLNAQPHDRGLNFLVSLLLVRTFNSLWRAREDAVTGYPVQSLALCRGALEDWVTACYVEKHRDRCDRWLVGILPEHAAAKPPVDFETMFKEIGGDVGDKARETYSVLSKFTHPDGRGMRWLMHWDPETTYLHFGGHFDDRALRFCLYFLLVQAQMSMERVAQLQHRVLNSVDAKWLERGNYLTDLGLAFINHVHRELSEVSAVNSE